ncbi:hypothetical protein ACGFNU_42935 [Spirillospora sp. NPDC048911]|uniref:hypothetical protein n=1 Tax=Spirillospora sp. NPDC048911 TaxID=3364527 RepID=UPI0037124DBB
MAFSLALLGLAAIIGGSVAIVADLTREPTRTEIKEAGAKEIAIRWQNLKVADIFPPTFEHGPIYAGTPSWAEGGRNDTPVQRIRRVAVVPAAPCGDAFDPKVAEALGRHGCRASLRATYVDATGTMATTLGVAVMADEDAASNAYSALGSLRDREGVRAVPAAGTGTERFDDTRRRFFHVGTNQTPYLFFRTSGWLLDRGRVDRNRMLETFPFADVALGRVMRRFSTMDAPCQRKDIAC